MGRGQLARVVRANTELSFDTDAEQSGTRAASATLCGLPSAQVPLKIVLLLVTYSVWASENVSY